VDVCHSVLMTDVVSRVLQAGGFALALAVGFATATASAAPGDPSGVHDPLPDPGQRTGTGDTIVGAGPGGAPRTGDPLRGLFGLEPGPRSGGTATGPSRSVGIFDPLPDVGQDTVINAGPGGRRPSSAPQSVDDRGRFVFDPIPN
jgi:hypothetical protein